MKQHLSKITLALFALAIICWCIAAYRAFFGPATITLETWWSLLFLLYTGVITLLIASIVNRVHRLFKPAEILIDDKLFEEIIIVSISAMSFILSLCILLITIDGMNGPFEIVGTFMKKVAPFMVIALLIGWVIVALVELVKGLGTHASKLSTGKGWGGVAIGILIFFLLFTTFYYGIGTWDNSWLKTSSSFHKDPKQKEEKVEVVVTENNPDNVRPSRKDKEQSKEQSIVENNRGVTLKNGNQKIATSNGGNRNRMPNEPKEQQ